MDHGSTFNRTGETAAGVFAIAAVTGTLLFGLAALVGAIGYLVSVTRVR